MATKEHEAAPSNPTPSTNKDDADDNQAIFKMAHNNPKEATAYVKDITTLVNTFMTHIRSFNRYKKLAAYQNFVFNLDKRLKELDKSYFENSSVDVVLDLVCDKTCKPFIEKPPVQQGEQQRIKKRQSEDNIPATEEVLSRMVSPEGFKPLDDTGKAAVVKLYANLQSAHDSLANIAGSIVDLAKVSSPDQFSFILSLTICPLIQLKLPPELCAPDEMHFEKERLTPEEDFEEEFLNIVLPHPKLSKIPNKHPTHCLAAATHLLLQKRVFNTKLLQATIVHEFGVEIKKLHLSMSGRKYNPGKKPSCKWAPSGDQHKTGKLQTNHPSKKLQRRTTQNSHPRVMCTKFRSQKSPHLIPVSWTLTMSYPMATMMTIPYWILFPPANSWSLKQKTQVIPWRTHND